MPELPEVENVVQGLRDFLLGKRINSFKVFPGGERSLGSLTEEEVAAGLVGRRFTSVERQGKFIKLYLTETGGVVAHLRMTGQFLQADLLKNDYETKYHRFYILLGGKPLYFADKRRFGTFHLTENFQTYYGLSRLGPDALGDKFSTDYLLDKLARRTLPIFLALQDQSVVAGIGNIYANEILYAAKINPFRSARSLSDEELDKAVLITKQVLRESIEQGGTSFSDYIHLNGVKGNYQSFLKVYGKDSVRHEGQDFRVTRRKISGRSAYFVSELQELK